MNGHTGRSRSESTGRVALTLQLLGAVLVVSSIVVGVFASHAGAAALTNGMVALKDGSSGAVATNPLVNHQVVDLSVAANSTLNRSSLEAAGFPSGAVPIKVLECSDIGGQVTNLPKKPTDCEPETIDAVAGAQQNGSLFVKGFTIYALPDPVDLGVSNGTVCDDAEHQCVLGFFSNQNDFSKPHLFSGPFQVTSTGTSNGAGSTNGSGASSSGSATAPQRGVGRGLGAASDAGEHRRAHLVAVAARRGLRIASDRVRPPSHSPTFARRLILIRTRHGRDAPGSTVRRLVPAALFAASLLVSAVALVDAVG